MIKNFEIRLILESIGVTVSAFLLAWVTGFVFSWVLFALQHKSGSYLKAFVRFFSAIITGVPHLILILLFFFGSNYLINEALFVFGGEGYRAEIPAFLIGCFSLACFFSGYYVKILIEQERKLPREERWANEAFVLTKRNYWFKLLLPQLTLRSLGAHSNQAVNLLKECSLLSLITVTEMVRRFELIAHRTHQAFWAYLVLFLIYVCLCKGLELCFKFLEKKSARFYGADQL